MNSPEPSGRPDAAAPSESLYQATKITRHGLTIYKRYAGENADYYLRLTVQGRRLTRKLLRTADDSFRVARRIHDELRAGRFACLDETKSRGDYVALQKLTDFYAAHARHVTGIQERTVSGAVGALKRVLRASHLDLSASTAVLTGPLLDTFKRVILTAAGADRLKERSAKISANSTIRQARSIFAKKLGPDFYRTLRLPDLKKFQAVTLFPVEKIRYRVPDAALHAKIRSEAVFLRQTDPAAYIIYLLAAGAGLRKGEIAHARVRWLEKCAPTDGAHQYWLRIQIETDFSPKSHRERRVPLDTFAAEAILELVAARDTETPRREVQPEDYLLPGHVTERTDQTFRRFSAWLRHLGWDRRETTHELRKLYGSEVAKQAGIRAAQCLLGHAQVTTTEDYYADPAQSIPNIRIVA